MNNENLVKEEIPLGTPVLYYNEWTGLNTEKFIDQFRQLTIEETQNLKVGDVIYVDTDPLHPKGKVYGWVKVQISTIEKIPNNELRIRYIGGLSYYGFLTTKGGISKKMVRAINEIDIANIIASDPLTKEIYNH